MLLRNSISLPADEIVFYIYVLGLLTPSFLEEIVLSGTMEKYYSTIKCDGFCENRSKSYNPAFRSRRSFQVPRLSATSALAASPSSLWG